MDFVAEKPALSPNRRSLNLQHSSPSDPESHIGLYTTGIYGVSSISRGSFRFVYDGDFNKALLLVLLGRAFSIFEKLAIPWQKN